MKPATEGPRRFLMRFVKYALCLLIGALAIAQESPDPTFRASTRLVQVDVVVKSKNAPVGGLGKDDFQVLDNGKPQQIAVFSVREASATPSAVEALPQGVVTNRPRYRGPEPVSATVVLIDAQNTFPEDQGYARLQALQYLDRAARQELVAVYSLDTKLKVLQEFTDDSAKLRVAINGYHMTQSLNMQDGTSGSPGLLTGLTGNAANAARAMNFQRQADITTAAFESIARHLQGLPGRKKLIWITASLPLTFTQENERNGVMMTEFTNMSRQIYGPMKLLNDANVAIYPIDPRGLGGNSAGAADAGITTMIRLAEMTGGKAFYNDNDVSVGIEEAFTDTDVTYTLGFYPTEDGLDGALHSIAVKVSSQAAETRYRKSYTADGPVKALTETFRKATLAAWVNQPLESTEIPIQAAAVTAVNKPGYYDVEVGVDVTALKLEQKNGLFVGSFEIAIVPDVEKKPKGLDQTIQVNLTPERLRAALDTGIVVINQIRATDKKGKLIAKKLHLVVMDRATGKTGSVRIPLN